MKIPEEYRQQLDDIYVRHYLALEQAEFSFPLYKNNKNNKGYEDEYNNIKAEFQESGHLLERLHKEIRNSNIVLRRQNEKLKKQLKEKRKIYKKVSEEKQGYDDTELALIEMKDNYKDLQNKTFIKALDISLGIVLVCYLIYKKSK